MRESVAHFLWGSEKATVPALTLSSVSMVKTKCWPGPVLTSMWGHDWSKHLVTTQWSAVNSNLTCLSKSLGLTMALLVIVRVSLGHFETFIRLLDIFLRELLGF